MPHIITVSGKAGAGKDTFANMLENAFTVAGKRVLITHYADPLKFICKNMFGWNGEKDEYGRHLLQYVGTDCIRKEEPNYFVNFVGWLIGLFGENWDYVIIPDARFDNEINLMKQNFLTTSIHITRKNLISELTNEAQAHISETALDGYPFDVEIENETIDGLSRSSIAIANFIMNPEDAWAKMDVETNDGELKVMEDDENEDKEA